MLEPRAEIEPLPEPTTGNGSIQRWACFGALRHGIPTRVLGGFGCDRSTYPALTDICSHSGRAIDPPAV